MGELMAGVNWLAVGIGTIASFMLGWLWYSPALFGKAWATGSRVNLANASAMPVTPLIAQLIATFLLAWLIGINDMRGSLATAALILVTIAAFVATNSMFVSKSGAAIAIETSFVIAMGVVMLAVHALL